MSSVTKASIKANDGKAWKRTHFRWRRPVIGLLVVCMASAGLWAWGRSSMRKGGPKPAEPEVITPTVDVIHPRKGGIERTTVQPGSVHSFESVDLFAMISGYMKSQAVDIGSRVKEGQVLAEIAIPREEKIAKEAEALLEQAKAQALQMEAKVKAAEADRDTAEAEIARAESDIARLAANRTLAVSKFGRIKALHAQHAVEMMLVDEQRHDRDAAIAAEKTGTLAVQTARSRWASAVAKVDQARADVTEARAAVEVAKARLAATQVDLEYGKIVAPFDGVVTLRSFHPGEFIRSAEAGSQKPVLTVSRTDLMRVVVQVPDRDVVLADAGDPAVVNIDGLNGKEFRAEVSRISNSANPTTRTMRIEIDLPNPDGLLRAGMYGRVRIALEPPSVRLTLPAACVLERSGSGGVVQVVRGGKVERVDVHLGADNGKLVELRSGVDSSDKVILRPSGGVEPGMQVVARPAA